MFHNVEQNTDEWLDLRKAKMTGSGVSKVMASSRELIILKVGKDGFKIANTGTKTVLAKAYETKIDAEKSLSIMYAKNPEKTFTDTAKKLAVTIAREQVTGKRSLAESYSNAHMERGHEQEPFARALYEDQYFVDVSNGGFFDDNNLGCSPDGLVNKDGLIEIKSVIDHVHYANIRRGGIDPTYKWQIFFNLMVTKRDWIDFVSYCADFPEETQLYVHRVNKNDCLDEFGMMAHRITEFFKLVEDAKIIISGGKQ